MHTEQRVKVLTVSIVNYRTPSLVVQCVASLKQYPPTDIALDIAVVDNGSGDGSLAIIRAAHPDIRLLDAGANLGFAGGNNIVLRNLSSDYVLLLNSDALVEGGTLDRLIETLDRNPSVGAVGARIVNADDGADQDYPIHFPSFTGMAIRALKGAEYPAAGFDSPVPMKRLHGAGMLIRGLLLDSVGLLDEGFFMYDEDVDWCVRARAEGWELWLVPNARVSHLGGASSGLAPNGQRRRIEVSGETLRMRYELRRSRYRLYRKHRSTLQVLTLKLVTDAVLAHQCVWSAALWLIFPSRRSTAQAILRSNLQIMAMNPFARSPSVKRA